MIIVGFAQLHEELRRGFLMQWLRSMDRLCDVIYIWDQDSCDGSKQEYKKHAKLRVVEHHCNDFLNEIDCKIKLLDKVKRECPSADWIFSMDGDTVLGEPGHDGLRGWLEQTNVDNVLLSHLNLWRGNTHHRVDNGFGGKVGGHVALWRLNETCAIAPARGLHKKQYPYPREQAVAPYHLLHFGFATDAVLYERMVTGKLPRLDPNPCNHHRHYMAPVLKPIPEGVLPPYIPRVESIHTPLPRI